MASQHLNDLKKAFTNYLQPKFDEFLDLQSWARICFVDIPGAPSNVLESLNQKLDGIEADSASLETMACPDPWTPSCSIQMVTTICHERLFFSVILVKSEIVDITFYSDVLSEALEGVDLVLQFNKAQLIAMMSRKP